MNNDSPSDQNIPAAIFADCLANSQEIFQLIEQIFPLDTCRHYQVLPLGLKGDELTLGMLNPNNQDSLKFVNSIANVFKYRLKLNSIDAQTHAIILSSYPQSSPSQAQSKQRSKQDQNQTVIDANFSSEAIPLNQTQRNRRNLADSAPTIISQPKQNLSAADSSLPPELAGLPADLDFLRDLNLDAPPAKPKASVEPTPTLFEIPPEFTSQNSVNNHDDQPTIIGGNPAEMLAASGLAPESQSQAAKPIAEPVLAENVDFLPQIKAHLSWQKLLDSVFKHRVEVIKLTRHSDRGSIVVYRQEEAQSSIDQLLLPTFCSLINEIKRMARLPQNTSSHPQKVVVERIFEEERILLRLEFLVEDEAEIVKVQILRNQALREYEQKQIDRISEQALQLAQQLEKALRKIQVCFDSAQLTNLSELQTVQGRINHQLRLLDKI